jgi:phosphoserine phosphatase RsbU/P
MGNVKGAFVSGWWLLKSMFFKLTPARRLLIVIACVLLLLDVRSNQQGVNVNLVFLGGLVVLFVLMLELKDKLVARKELEAGRAVQMALMPERSPSVPGWNLWLFTRSANEVGGDLVDFLKVSESRFGVALGDVAGKGLSAALLATRLQATLRALVHDCTSMSELGSLLNTIFCRDCLRSIFSSLAYIELHPDSGTARILNAGHFPPIIIRGSRIERMEKGGPALGIMPDPSYVEEKLVLQPGELLFVYSDGLTEARNVQGEFFGERRLSELLAKLTALPPNRLGERVVAEVDRFIGDARVNDDLSIAIIGKA